MGGQYPLARDRARSRSPFSKLIATVVLLGALVLAALGAPAAIATTGPTPLAHPPRFNVTKAEAAPYLGRFTLVPPTSDQLISGAYVAGYNERHFVEGTLVIYTYDAEGHETTLLGRTYEYHSEGDQMEIDVISPTNQAILARMKLHPVAGGKLSGTLTSLMPKGKPEPMTLGPAPEAGSTASEVAPEPAESGTATGEPSALPSETVATVVAAVRSAFRF